MLGKYERINTNFLGTSTAQNKRPANIKNALASNFLLLSFSDLVIRRASHTSPSVYLPVRPFFYLDQNVIKLTHSLVQPIAIQ